MNCSTFFYFSYHALNRKREIGRFVFVMDWNVVHIPGPPEPPGRFRALRPVNEDSVLLGWSLPGMDELGRSNGVVVRGYRVSHIQPWRGEVGRRGKGGGGGGNCCVFTSRGFVLGWCDVWLIHVADSHRWRIQNERQQSLHGEGKFTWEEVACIRELPITTRTGKWHKQLHNND